MPLHGADGRAELWLRFSPGMESPSAFSSPDSGPGAPDPGGGLRVLQSHRTRSERKAEILLPRWKGAGGLRAARGRGFSVSELTGLSCFSSPSPCAAGLERGTRVGVLPESRRPREIPR